jgi:hypothetical protein
VAFLFFVDESGQDHRESPYEVLGGIVVEDSRIWPLITAIQQAEAEHFGRRTTHATDELKAKRLLKTKTFRLAAQLPPIDPAERVVLVKAALEEGDAAEREGRQAKVTRRQLTALGQAKVAFCGRVLELCLQHQGRAFASIIDCEAPRPSSRTMLSKEYSYLFERLFLFLEQHQQHGIVVFDELEHSQSLLLVQRMAEYFLNTSNGRQRSARILPEPMFVHSELTSLIQVADLIVYLISWGVRIKGMVRPPRPELAELAAAIQLLRYRTVVSTSTGDYERWSFAYIDDLRHRGERLSKKPPEAPAPVAVPLAVVPPLLAPPAQDQADKIEKGSVAAEATAKPPQPR